MIITPLNNASERVSPDHLIKGNIFKFMEALQKMGDEQYYISVILEKGEEFSILGEMTREYKHVITLINVNAKFDIIMRDSPNIRASKIMAEKNVEYRTRYFDVTMLPDWEECSDKKIRETYNKYVKKNWITDEIKRDLIAMAFSSSVPRSDSFYNFIYELCDKKTVGHELLGAIMNETRIAHSSAIVYLLKKNQPIAADAFHRWFAVAMTTYCHSAHIEEILNILVARKCAICSYYMQIENLSYVIDNVKSRPLLDAFIAEYHKVKGDEYKFKMMNAHLIMNHESYFDECITEIGPTDICYLLARAPFALIQKIARHIRGPELFGHNTIMSYVVDVPRNLTSNFITKYRFGLANDENFVKNILDVDAESVRPFKPSAADFELIAPTEGNVYIEPGVTAHMDGFFGELINGYSCQQK